MLRSEQHDDKELDVFDEKKEDDTEPTSESSETPKDGANDGSTDEDPPLESADLPDLTFDDPNNEPPLESNELPEATYGAQDAGVGLVEVDLPDLTFGSSDGIVESVPEGESAGVVLADDDDASVILDDSTPNDGTEASPVPGHPEPRDPDDASDESSGSYTYEIAVNPLFEHLELVPVYPEDDDEDDMDGD